MRVPAAFAIDVMSVPFRWSRVCVAGRDPCSRSPGGRCRVVESDSDQGTDLECLAPCGYGARSLLLGSCSRIALCEDWELIGLDFRRAARWRRLRLHMGNV